MKCVRLLLVLCLLSGALSATRKDKERKKDRVKNASRNPCSTEEQDAPIHCFCDGGGAPGNVTSTECWIFNNKLTRDYAFWSYFASQPRISTMKIIVRPNANLSFIPTKALRYLKELRVFEITYAAIDEIHPYAFANLSQLTDVKLTRNQIVNLEHHGFAHLHNLTDLNLDENRISELQRDVFIDLPSLQKLYITQNNLSVIQEGTFRHLTKLLELELSSNYITILTKDTFTGLGELKRLDLNNNRISMLGDLTFAELWVLEELLLESNQIELIADRAFAGLTNLKRLTLSRNRLTILSPTLLGGVPDIHHLDLRFNNLETLTLDNVRPILHNLYSDTSNFYIENNRFVCDCRMAWMHTLRNETKNEIIRNVLDDLICHLQPESDFHHQTIPKPINDNVFPDEDAFDEDIYNGEDYNNNYDRHQQDSSSNSVTEGHDPSLKHLLQIPLNELPCPEKENPTEETLRRNLNTPSYAEINSGCSSIRALTILVTILFICLT